MGRGSWVSPHENKGPVFYTPGAREHLDSFRKRLKAGERLADIIAEEIGADRVYELIVDPDVLSDLAIRRDLIDQVRANRAQQTEA